MKPLFALASACALLVATPVFACSEAEAEKMGKEVATKVASTPRRTRNGPGNSTSSCASARKPARNRTGRAIAMPTRRCSRNWIRKR